MAKQVIVLTREIGDVIRTSGVVWLAVPASFQAIVANPVATSRFTLATSAEVAAIQLGQIAEVPFTSDMPKSATLNQQKVEFLHTASVLTVTYLSSQAIGFQFYGAFWDGTSWSV